MPRKIKNESKVEEVIEHIALNKAGVAFAFGWIWASLAAIKLKSATLEDLSGSKSATPLLEDRIRNNLMEKKELDCCPVLCLPCMLVSNCTRYWR